MAGDFLFKKYQGYALITGAAQGIGLEFAKQLAAQGFPLLLVDINDALLKETSKTIESSFGVDVKAITLDLGDEHFLEKLITQTQDLDIGLLINNAGISSIQHFLRQDLKALEAQLNINCRAVLYLTHYFAKHMAKRSCSGIIIVSSGAAEMPSAYNASYSASKAYELRLAESLWMELKETNIDVLGFMPVTTNTPALYNQGFKENSAHVMSTEQSVKEALHYLGKRPSVTAGKFGRFAKVLMTLMPVKLKLQIVTSHLKKMFPEL